MEKLLKELREAISSIDEMEDEMEFFPIANKILDKMKTLPNSIDAIEKILKIIEENDDKEYGMLAIGHFLESFYGNKYEELLIESLQREPKAYTIYLLHRCINDEKNERRDDYIRLIKEISEDPQISREIREEAKEFLGYFE